MTARVSSFTPGARRRTAAELLADPVERSHQTRLALHNADRVTAELIRAELSGEPLPLDLAADLVTHAATVMMLAVAP